MIITEASSADLDGIVALEQIGFAPGARWSRESWDDEMAGEDGVVLCARDIEAQVSGVAAFRIVEDVAELFRIAVKPERRRGGLGSRLLRAGMVWATAAGAKRMLLEVRTGNTAAERLYQEFGFEPVTVRRDYYGPGESAIVMEHSLTPTGGTFGIMTLIPKEDDDD